MGCFHLIITTADINENQVMHMVCMGTDNEREGGQILRKCRDEVGDREDTELRGEALGLYFSFSA